MDPRQQLENAPVPLTLTASGLVLHASESWKHAAKFIFVASGFHSAIQHFGEGGVNSRGVAALLPPLVETIFD